jgi:hypothetical protein
MHISYQKVNVKQFDEKILTTLLAIQERYNKPYSFPSQEKILALCHQYYGISRCKRTLNYRLKYLEQQGFIVRKKRIKRLRNGTLKLATTLYFLTTKAYSYIKNLCRFVTRILKRRPSWVKQFQLKDQIKIIETIDDPGIKRSKYLELINDTLS